MACHNPWLPGADRRLPQRQADRRAMLAAIDAGLLRRALVVARRGCTATHREGGDGPMQPQPPLSAETFAPQALGDVDPVSGGLTPGINPATSYEQLPDGSYRQDRVYTPDDNPPYETAQGLP